MKYTLILTASVLCLLLLVGCGSGQSADYTAVVVPEDGLDTVFIKENRKTEYLVLGTPHLSQFGDSFDPDVLTELLTELEAYSPAAICIESMPPRILENMREHPEYEMVIDNFASVTVEIGLKTQQRLGISWNEAYNQSREQLRELELSQVTDETAHRLKLIPMLLACYDTYTAALQWRYLSNMTRVTTEAITKEEQSRLKQILNAANENTTIGLELAYRLGLQRIHPIDDHSENDRLTEIALPYLEELRATGIESEKLDAYIKKHDQMLQEAYDSGNMLGYYQTINRLDHLLANVEAQWVYLMYREMPGDWGRRRVSLWHVRNLDMASNVVRAGSHVAGEKVLTIVGSGHKPFLDEYLAVGIDSRVVQLDTVLGQGSATADFNEDQ